MNRVDLQAIAHRRLAEAEHLLAGKYFSGAYYLSGYVVECALKACIAKSTQEHDFPDRKRVNDSYSHDLTQLLRTATLDRALRDARVQNPNFGQRWDIVQQWNEGSRYRFGIEDIEQEEAETMLDAVGNRDEGVLLWLTHFW